ncbi:MAG TPA: 16S rRNA (cytosine(967)-C(5))-methyltransferase RsmB, partial [Candidatus Aphodomonas merdavium]|nr:16S rRNA (cytosine(967)-C(5))-methyltransferase RsmB [Candidatus Aphodomonas merdavium]
MPKKAAPRRFSHPEAKPVKQEAAPRRFARPEEKPSGAPQRYPHPEAKPVGGQGLPQRSLHPQGQPPAAQGRPFGQEGKAQRPAANARLMALNILQDVTRAGAYASLALGERLRESTLAQRDRDFVAALVYGTLEKQITLDWLIDGKLEREGGLDALVRDILRLGLYQILFLTRVPDSAAVDESVKLSRLVHRDGQAGFINALLRGFARDKFSIAWPSREASPAFYLSVRYSLPQWIAEKLIAEYGFGEAEDIASYEPASRPIAVRRCLERSNPREFEAMMTEKGWSWQPSRLPDVYLVSSGIGDVGIEKEYLRGLYSVQSESSVLAALCVAPSRGASVLDACAAPGGKTACLAEAMRGTGRVYAWDKHEHRVELIRSMVKRLRLDNVRPAVRDATVIKQGLLGTMDAVLVDAPCSGLGVMLSKPDVKYRHSPQTIEALVKEQEALLDACCGYVKP